MSAKSVTEAEPCLDSLDTARDQVVSKALRPSVTGTVGLELEFHVVDRRRPAARVGWSRLIDLLATVPAPPSGSRVTVEPGGQVELSSPPVDGVGAAVRVLQRDTAALSASLAGAGLLLASVGADPAREVRRMSPAGRYVAMERHFTAIGAAEPGRTMMCATAALQVNLDAGPESGWSARVGLMHLLGPVLVAMSACSPLISGEASGWRSMRQQAWGQIDRARCGPLLDRGEPAEQWARYALVAPVMLTRDPATGAVQPVTRRVPFAAWVTGAAPLADRRPTAADLDLHLTTLFPPVRLRGFLELRCLDAVPLRWWPGLAGLVATLLDDPHAAEVAVDACQPAAGAWTAAARDGLQDPVIARAATRCAEVAVERCPTDLRRQVEAYAEMVTDGRSPGDELAALAAATSPLHALEEEAGA
jgi:ergothioneine biosynthesis glutamate--cysteine ligase EgtA